MILDAISRLDKVLILGFAREGQSTYKFLRQKFPQLTIILADQKKPDHLPFDPKIETYFGSDYLNSMLNAKCQMIIKSPGISPHKPEIVEAKQRGIVFTSQTQIFFELCPGKIIGVTGTKGKSTTASLIHHVIPNSHLVGNIGKPALDYLDDIKPNDWVVIELSSYQLMDLHKSPHIAILLNIYPDHLDYHTNFEEYKTAKLNITRYQTANDYFITVQDFPTRAQKIIITPEPVKSNLLGQHNLYNIKPALIIGELLQIPKPKILKSIQTFAPLDTRLTEIKTINNISFYEDTLATIPEATIAAIDALSGIHSGVTTLICGGHDRKQNYSNLAIKILNSGISTLILFPETGQRIAEEIIKLRAGESEQERNGNHEPQRMVGEHLQSLSPNAIPKIFNVASMPNAVNLAFQNTPQGGIVLLSPAAPSFTLFKDYRDESAQYRQAIDNLIHN